MAAGPVRVSSVPGLPPRKRNCYSVEVAWFTPRNALLFMANHCSLSFIQSYQDLL